MSVGWQPQTRAALLVLQARTALHPGTGTVLGRVDLPIQRERHTGWPTISSSSIKGVLRDACREQLKSKYERLVAGAEGPERRSPRRRANEEDAELVAVFGPGRPEESGAYAGALAVSDARILAFPVRSLRGVFAWVTCPGVLERLSRDAKWSGLNLPDIPLPAPLARQQALPGSAEVVVGDREREAVVLEEFEFAAAGRCDALARWLSDHVAPDPLTAQRLRGHLVVLHDDDFTYFVQYATEVVARAALDYERKTIREEEVLFEEYLPAETILYSVVLANETRRTDRIMSASEVLGFLKEKLPEVLQIGANETIGKGFCATRLVS
jgi:CRISPR-associated protein Cmr4